MINEMYFLSIILQEKYNDNQKLSESNFTKQIYSFISHFLDFNTFIIFFIA